MKKMIWILVLVVALVPAMSQIAQARGHHHHRSGGSILPPVCCCCCCCIGVGVSVGTVAAAVATLFALGVFDGPKPGAKNEAKTEFAYLNGFSQDVALLKQTAGSSLDTASILF